MFRGWGGGIDLPDSIPVNRRLSSSGKSKQTGPFVSRRGTAYLASLPFGVFVCVCVFVYGAAPEVEVGGNIEVIACLNISSKKNKQTFGLGLGVTGNDTVQIAVNYLHPVHNSTLLNCWKGELRKRTFCQKVFTRAHEFCRAKINVCVCAPRVYYFFQNSSKPGYV